MYYCSECRNTFTRVEDIIVHTKYIHNIGSANFRKSFCPFINCSVQLSSWSGYLRHLKSHDVSTAINVIEVINAVVSHEALESLPTNNNNKLDEDEVVEDISVELGIQIMSDILSSGFVGDSNSMSLVLVGCKYGKMVSGFVVST